MPEDKKRWIVRTWGQNLEGARSRAEDLERTLNEMDALGYDVRDINTDEKLLIGHIKECTPAETQPQQAQQSKAEERPKRSVPPGMPEVLRRLIRNMSALGPVQVLSPHMSPEQVQELQREATAEKGRHEEPKGKRTRAFMQEMCPVMEALGRGLDSKSAEQRVECIVKEVFKTTLDDLHDQAAEVRESILDIEAFQADHNDGSECDGTCPTQQALRLGIKQLHKFLESNPGN